MSTKTLLLARPSERKEWLQIDRLCNGLLNWSEPKASKLLLDAAPVIFMHPVHNEMEFVLVLEGNKKSLPWEFLEDLAKHAVERVYYYGGNFLESDKKRLGKIFSNCQDWEGLADDNLSIPALP